MYLAESVCLVLINPNNQVKSHNCTNKEYLIDSKFSAPLIFLCKYLNSQFEGNKISKNDQPHLLHLLMH